MCVGGGEVVWGGVGDLLLNALCSLKGDFVFSIPISSLSSSSVCCCCFFFSLSSSYTVAARSPGFTNLR